MKSTAARISSQHDAKEDDLDEAETERLNDAIERADAQYQRGEFADVESALKRFRDTLYKR